MYFFSTSVISLTYKIDSILIYEFVSCMLFLFISIYSYRMSTMIFNHFHTRYVSFPISKINHSFKRDRTFRFWHILIDFTIVTNFLYPFVYFK